MLNKLFCIHRMSMQSRGGQHKAVLARTIGRLTPELILRSPQYMNCVQQYELDLRDNMIQLIENLGVTENQFDSIDVSDNAIATLDGFPILRRLRCLFANNNRISRISETLGESLPNLEWLILTNNKVSSFVELEKSLKGLSKLKYLSLMDNPIAKKQDYRMFVISRCPRLKVLDYKKVTKTERERAQEECGSRAAASFEGVSSSQDKDSVQETTTKNHPSKEQLMAIKAAIANATTMEEVTRLEQSLEEGQKMEID